MEEMLAAVSGRTGEEIVKRHVITENGWESVAVDYL